MSDSPEAKEVYDVELDYTPIIIAAGIIVIVLLLMWFLNRGDISYSPVSGSVPADYDISTAFDIVS